LLKEPARRSLTYENASKRKVAESTMLCQTMIELEYTFNTLYGLCFEYVAWLAESFCPPRATRFSLSGKMPDYILNRALGPGACNEEVLAAPADVRNRRTGDVCGSGVRRDIDGHPEFGAILPGCTTAAAGKRFPGGLDLFLDEDRRTDESAACCVAWGDPAFTPLGHINLDPWLAIDQFAGCQTWSRDGFEWLDPTNSRLNGQRRTPNPIQHTRAEVAVFLGRSAPGCGTGISEETPYGQEQRTDCDLPLACGAVDRGVVDRDDPLADVLHRFAIIASQSLLKPAFEVELD
jgi:hypothetical protein